MRHNCSIIVISTSGRVKNQRGNLKNAQILITSSFCDVIKETSLHCISNQNNFVHKIEHQKYKCTENNTMKQIRFVVMATVLLLWLHIAIEMCFHERNFVDRIKNLGFVICYKHRSKITC